MAPGGFLVEAEILNLTELDLEKIELELEDIKLGMMLCGVDTN